MSGQTPTQRRTALKSSWRLQSWVLQLAMHAQVDRYKALYEPTDAWNAERSSAGQRALRIGDGKWVPVLAASRGGALASGPAQSSTQTVRRRKNSA